MAVVIKNFIPRLYQETIFDSCTTKNTLVVLPTGLGKTAIALMLAAHRLSSYPDSKIVFLAPTKPLVEQHKKTFMKHLDIDERLFVALTGTTPPKKRAELWNDAKMVFSTPQGLENDILSGRISLRDVSLMIFDEAHRAVGDYSYCFIAKRYCKTSNFERILALTASPGSDIEKIDEVCKNLSIENIEIRTYDDPDVKQYISPIDTEFIEFELPEQMSRIKKFLDNCYLSKLESIKKFGFIRSTKINKKELLQLQANLQARIARGDKNAKIWSAISIAAEALKVHHALELLETQSPVSLLSYIGKLQEEATRTKSKAVQNLTKDINFKSAAVLAKKAVEEGLEHPKFVGLIDIVKKEIEKNNAVKIIIFNNFRENAARIVSALAAIGIKTSLFIGQARKDGSSGLSQKSQTEILEKFKRNEFNALVATSVGEEGLDVPKVDLVIFYEPIPSAIRHIQRRGRTGRGEKGRLVILITKNTRDHAYRWSSYHKEKRMHRILKALKKRYTLKPREEKKLTDFTEEIKIIADHREKGNKIMKDFLDMGMKIDLKKLDYADYILSSRVGVELKSVEDFVVSLLDGRLLEQVKMLKENFERPLIVIEGTEDIFSQRNVHPNAIRGLFATIIVNYGVPIIQTKNSTETAALLAIIAKREQENGGREARLHQKKPLTMSEIQEYIVSAFPSVGPSLAKELLKNFKTIKKIANASEDELKKVDGVGDKIAKSIKSVVENEYK